MKKITTIGKLLFRRAKRKNSTALISDSFCSFCGNGGLEFFQKKGKESYIKTLKAYKKII